MKRFTRIGAGLTITVAMLVGVAAPAYAATAALPNPNPAGQTYVVNSQLPTCAGSKPDSVRDSYAGQGWIGDWQLPMQQGARTAWAVLFIPCWDGPPATAVSPRVPTWFWILDNSSPGTFVDPIARVISISMVCDGATHTIPGLPYEAAGVIPNGAPQWVQAPAPAAPGGSFCNASTSTLTSVSISWSVNFNGSQLLGTAVWSASTWSQSGTNQPKATTVGNIPFPGGAIETPIICNLVVDQSDILTVIGSFFGAFADWVGCMFTPAGWDRSGRIPQTFEQSGLSRTDDIINIIVPSAGHIFCGDVGGGTAFGMTITVNTCDAATFVPTWAKVGVNLITILSLFFVIIRRIQWTVTP